MSTDFEKTKAILAKLQETEEGWGPGRENAEFRGEPQSYIYLVDLRTGFMWACAIPNRILATMYQKTKANPQLYKVVTASLPQLIRECADGQPELTVGATWEEWLGRCLAIYFVSGSRYETDPPKHLVMINYEVKDGTMIRPFVLAGGGDKDEIAPFDVVEQMTAGVIERDRVRYPDWGIK